MATATGTWVPYDLTFEKALNGDIDFHGNTNLYLYCTTSAHTPNSGTHDFEANAVVTFDVVENTPARDVVIASGAAVLEESGKWRRIVDMPSTPGTYLVRCTATYESTVIFKDETKVKVKLY